MSSAISISLLFILTLLSQNDVVSSTLTQMKTICIPSAGNYTARGAYQNNLGKALTSLTTAAVSANATFSNATAGVGRDEAFALYYCTGGTTTEECSTCVQAAVAEVVGMCPNYREAITWYVECTLRYANRIIVGIEEDRPYAWLTSNKTVPDYVNLGKVLINTTVELTQEAALNSTGNPPGYAAKQVAFSSTETLLALLQCAPGVTGTACVQCLSKATSDLSTCCSLFSYINFMLLPSCRLLLFVQTSNSSTSSPSPFSNSPEFPPESSPTTVVPFVSPPPPPLTSPPVSPPKNGCYGFNSNGNIAVTVISLAIFLILCLAHG